MFKTRILFSDSRQAESDRRNGGELGGIPRTGEQTVSDPAGGRADADHRGRREDPDHRPGSDAATGQGEKETEETFSRKCR